jgi:hypothetical protein
MRTDGILPVLALTFGVVAALTGVGLIGSYVWWAVVARWGASDQSLLFWYLPFLLFGLGSIVIGSTAGAWGLRRLRSENRGTE